MKGLHAPGAVYTQCERTGTADVGLGFLGCLYRNYRKANSSGTGSSAAKRSNISISSSDRGTAAATRSIHLFIYRVECLCVCVCTIMCLIMGEQREHIWREIIRATRDAESTKEKVRQSEGIACLAASHLPAACTSAKNSAECGSTAAPCG